MPSKAWILILLSSDEAWKILFLCFLYALGKVSSNPSLSTHADYTQAVVSYLAFSAIHRFFLKVFPDFKVDLSGANGGGGFNVELVAILADLHVGFGGSCHGHFPQHGVDAWAKVGKHNGQRVNVELIRTQITWQEVAAPSIGFTSAGET